METIKVTQPCKEKVVRVRSKFKEELVERFWWADSIEDIELGDVIFWLADEKLNQREAQERLFGKPAEEVP